MNTTTRDKAFFVMFRDGYVRTDSLGSVILVNNQFTVLSKSEMLAYPGVKGILPLKLNVVPDPWDDI